MSKARRAKTIISKKKKIALVCSGGAAKAGAYHLGVALALKEKGFRFLGGVHDGGAEIAAPAAVQTPDKDGAGREISTYVGSSAGSIICSFLAAGYSLDDIFDSFLRKKGGALRPLTYQTMFSLKKDSGVLSALYAFTDDAESGSRIGRLIKGLASESYKNVFQMAWLKLPGMFSTAGIEKYMREHVLPSNDFKRYRPDLFLVGTQLNHSRKVVFGRYDALAATQDKGCLYMNNVDISEACAASTSLPPIFAPYPITHDGGRKVYYFDGEIRDTLSTHVAVDGGADLVFASYTHQPYHYTREIGSLHEYGIPMILIQMIYLIIERRIQQYRHFHEKSRAACEAIDEVLKNHGVASAVRRKCLEAFEEKMHFRRDVDVVYIRPRPTDHELFFGDHFNLNPHKLKEIVRIGFRNTIDTLRRYEFE